MGRKRTLTQDLEAHVVEHARAGKSSRWISTWLARSHGVELDQRNVSRLLRRHRSDLANAAKVVTRATLGARVPALLDAFGRRTRALARVLRKLEGKALAAPTDARVVRTYLAALAGYRRCVETTLHFTGADQPDDAVDGFAGFLALGFDTSSDA